MPKARSEPTHERQIFLVGAGIAAASALVLLASPSVAWYRHLVFCTYLNCPSSRTSGWTSLGAGSALLVAAALAGLLPLVSLAAPRMRSILCGVGLIAGLAAGLLVLFRISVPPLPAATGPVTRLPGPFIALLGASGIACGAALAGLGERLFDPAPNVGAVLLVAVIESVVIISALFLPWSRQTTAIRIPSAASAQSAWSSAPTVAVLLLLGSLAIVCACALIAVIRWRCSFFALAVAGFLLAAIAAAGTPLEHDSTPTTSGGHGVGYYICLAAAAVIAIGSTSAIVEDQRTAGCP